MASRDIGTIQLKGTVVIEWDNGTRTEVGSVSTYVEMKLPDEEPITITKTWEPEQP